MAFVGIRFELGACVLTEYDDDGHLTAQPDALGNDPRVTPYELHHQAGFDSRPQDPELDPDGYVIEGKGCTLLMGSIGNENHAWLGADPRFVASRPPLEKGDVVQYALRTVPSFDIHKGDDGTKTIYVEVGDSAHVITVGLDGNGDSIISLIHADGMAVIMQHEKLILKNAAGDAYIELNDSGGVLNGNWQITGDIFDSLGVSLLGHIHSTGVGPSGPPLPGV
jgi:hypothetical protein